MRKLSTQGVKNKKWTNYRLRLMSQWAEFITSLQYAVKAIKSDPVIFKSCSPDHIQMVLCCFLHFSNLVL